MSAEAFCVGFKQPSWHGVIISLAHLHRSRMTGVGYWGASNSIASPFLTQVINQEVFGFFIVKIRKKIRKILRHKADTRECVYISSQVYFLFLKPNLSPLKSQATLDSKTYTPEEHRKTGAQPHPSLLRGRKGGRAGSHQLSPASTLTNKNQLLLSPAEEWVKEQRQAKSATLMGLPQCERRYLKWGGSMPSLTARSYDLNIFSFTRPRQIAHLKCLCQFALPQYHFLHIHIWNHRTFKNLPTW